MKQKNMKQRGETKENKNMYLSQWKQESRSHVMCSGRVMDTT